MLVAGKRTYTSRKSMVVSMMCLLLFLVPLASCGGPSTSETKPTPTSVPTSASSGGVKIPDNLLTTIDLGLPEKALKAPVTGTVPDDQMMHVGITFKTDPKTIDQLDKDGKAKVGEKKSSEELANQLGISEATYEQLKAFFGIENATLKLGKLRTNMTVDAKAKTFGTLFQTNFVLHKLDNRTFYTPNPAKPPKLPKVIADQILAITGLDNYSTPPTHKFSKMADQLESQLASVKKQGTLQNKAANCEAHPETLTPQQIAHVYGYDQFWEQGWTGKGLTVNFIEVDGVSETDLNNYFACVGYRGKVSVVTVGDSVPAPGFETQLDIQMVAGLAPDVNMVTYQTDLNVAQSLADAWTRVNDALIALINDNADKPDTASVVSISLGSAEEEFTIGNFRAISQNLEIISKVLHMSIFVSSGDCGAFETRVFKQLAVSYPGSDPSVISVGGTILAVDEQGNRAGEVAWSDGADTSQCVNQWGTGGGLSSIFPQPEWQKQFNVENKEGARQLPDVSAVAYAVAMYFDGQWIGGGGTSASAPIWAAGMVLLNSGLIAQKQTFFYGASTFYELAAAVGPEQIMFDVTRGDNLHYPATPGWDYPTGLGSPNLPAFYDTLLKAIG